jgi:hypothetical protein
MQGMTRVGGRVAARACSQTVLAMLRENRVLRH